MCYYDDDFVGGEQMRGCKPRRIRLECFCREVSSEAEDNFVCRCREVSPRSNRCYE